MPAHGPAQGPAAVAGGVLHFEKVPPLWKSLPTDKRETLHVFKGAEKKIVFCSREKLATRLWAENLGVEPKIKKKVRSARAERLKIGHVALTFRGEAAQHAPGS